LGQVGHIRFLKAAPNNAPDPTLFVEIAMMAKLVNVGAARSFVKLLMAALKVFAFMTMLTIMVTVCLCTSYAVPQYLPSSMVPAWKMLETLPLWEALDSSTIISERLSQWNTTNVDLAASTANVHIVLGQAPCCFWVVSSVASFFLVLYALLAAVGFAGKCMRLVVCVVRPHAAMTESSGDHLPSDGSGKESQINSPGASPALAENNIVNIQTVATTEEKKADKKGAQKRVESPAPRAMKAGAQTNKEDIPPMMVSSAPQKQPEGHEEMKGALKKRNESPAPRAARPVGMHRSEALPASAQSPSRKQEIQALRQRTIVSQRMAGLNQGMWNQGGSAWPGNAWQGGWQGGAQQGNAWAWSGHNNAGQWGRNGW